MLLAMQPSVLPQPTMPAMVSSFMQFCSDTTYPSGARYCRSGPGRVIGLHAHEGDVDRRLPGQLLRVRDVQRAHRNREFRDVPGVGDAQPVLPHVLDVLGPWIDERDVLARLHHMGAGIPADGSRSDNSYLPTHAFLPAFLAAEA